MAGFMDFAGGFLSNLGAASPFGQAIADNQLKQAQIEAYQSQAAQRVEGTPKNQAQEAWLRIAQGQELPGDRLLIDRENAFRQGGVNPLNGQIIAPTQIPLPTGIDNRTVGEAVTDKGYAVPQYAQAMPSAMIPGQGVMAPQQAQPQGMPMAQAGIMPQPVQVASLPTLDAARQTAQVVSGGNPIVEAPAPLVAPQDAQGRETELPVAGSGNANDFSDVKVVEDVTVPTAAPTQEKPKIINPLEPVDNEISSASQALNNASTQNERDNAQARLNNLYTRKNQIQSQQQQAVQNIRSDYKERVSPIEETLKKYQSAQQLAQAEDGIADYNLIKLGVQIYDDRASVVTDPEIEQMRSGAGLVTRFGQQMKGYETGEKLSPAQRQAILKVVESKAATQEKSLNNINKAFDNRAAQQGIDFAPLRADYALPSVKELKESGAAPKITKTLSYDKSGRRVQ